MLKFCQLFLGVLIFLTVFPASALAEDVVILKRDGRTTKRVGKIVDWQGKRISIATGSRTQTVNSDEVIELQTQWPEALIEARQTMLAKDFNLAIRQFITAMAKEQRSWVQTIILAEQIQALDAIENLALASEQFLKLYSLDPNSRFFNLIPLSWSIGENKPPSKAQCEKWLASKNPVALLLGASWQLQTNSRAVDVMESLTSHQDKRIAQLAVTQLWRMRQSSATPVDLERWNRQMVKIPVDLQAGPLIVLASVQKKLGAGEKAQINLLKLPILYPQKKIAGRIRSVSMRDNHGR